MSTKVKVVADELNNIITQTLNPEIGYVRLEQQVNSINGNWIKSQKRSCIIFGKHDDLKAFNLNPNQELDGKIIVEESFIPFNPSNAEREIKMAGDTGVPCLVDGQPIYRRTRYTTNLMEQDVLIQHNNTEDIREAINASKELNIVLQ